MTPDQREKAELEADRDREERRQRTLEWTLEWIRSQPKKPCFLEEPAPELINERKIPTTLNGEKQSATYYMAPVCRCGSRQTKQIGDSALTRQCQVCERTFWYRLHDGMLIPYGHETAIAIDEERAHGC